MTEQMEMFPTNKQYVLVPYWHIESVMKTYLTEIGVIDRDRNVQYLGVPVQVDEELLVTIEINYGELN